MMKMKMLLLALLFCGLSSVRSSEILFTAEKNGVNACKINGGKITKSIPQPGFVWARANASGSGHCGIVAYDGRIISAGRNNVNRIESDIDQTLQTR